MNARLRRFAGALARAKNPCVIKTGRGVERATQAVDAGLCKFTREVKRHSVLDPHWRISFGIELTDEGKKCAA